MKYTLTILVLILSYCMVQCFAQSIAAAHWNYPFTWFGRIRIGSAKIDGEPREEKP